MSQSQDINVSLGDQIKHPPHWAYIVAPIVTLLVVVIIVIIVMAV